MLRAPDGSIIARYGKPVVPPTAVYMFGDIRKAIAARRIPDEFKNMILPMKGRHDDVWLLSLESGQLWRFHRSGRLLATGGVPPEYLKARQEAFFDAGVHTPPESVPFPDIIRGAVVTKNGVVVELAQSDSAPARLMMFDTLGTVIGDEVLPPLPSRVGLIQDSYHDRVLYYDTETGALLAAHQ